MRKYKSTCMMLIMFLCLCFNVNAKKGLIHSRLTAQIDGINYALFEDIIGAYVYSSREGYQGNIVIPESVVIGGETYPVAGMLPDTFRESNGLSEIDIRCKIKSLGECEFYHCRNLESVKLPQGLIKINEKAFCYCNKLNEVIIPDSVLSIQERAFGNCYNLNNITLPENLSCLGKWAFSNCYNLKTINIPENISKLGEGVFEECVNLERVSMGDNLEKIGNNAFYHCVNLNNLEFPERLSYIGDKAFSRCSNIENLIFPEEVKYLGWDSFEYCTNIEWIRFLSESPPKVCESAFYLPRGFKGEKIDVFVPPGSTGSYKRSLILKFGCASANPIIYNNDEELYLTQ